MKNRSIGLAVLLGVILLVPVPASAQESEPTTVEEVATEVATEVAPDLGPAAVERRVSELRRHVKEDIARSNWDRARRNLSELVSLRKYSADFQVTLGLVYRQLGNLPEARRKYRDFVEANGNPALAALLLAESFAQDGQRDKAFEHLEKAAEEGMNVMRAASQFPALKPYTADTQFIRLALRLEHYELQSASRIRDPFTPNSASTELTSDVFNPTRWARPQQEVILAQARDDLKRIEFSLRSQNEEAAMHSYRELQKKVPYVEHLTEPDLAAEFRAILDRLSEIEELIKGLKLTYLYDQAKAEIENMERAFRNRDFPLVDKMRSEVEGLAREMETTDSTFVEVSDTVRKVADSWVNRARTWRDFNSRELKVQGIIIDQGTGAVVNDGKVGDSFAIIDNRTYRVGDVYDDMQVIQVEPNQVWFAFRGEKIPLVFRRY